MIVVGFDPGVTTGVAVVELLPRVRPRCHAVTELPGDATFDDFDVWMAGADLVAIERTWGVAYASKGAGIVPNLIECAAVDGGLVRIAESRNRLVARLRAVDWRRALLGKTGATDAEVAVWAARAVDGLPKRTNAHQRDALGVAVAAGMQRTRGKYLAVAGGTR